MKGAQLLQQLQDAIKVSLSQAITQVFLIASGMMVAAFVVALLLREIPLRRSHRPARGASGPGEPK